LLKHRRPLAVIAAALAVALVPAAAEAATKTVFAGPPGKVKGLPKAADFNAFFPKKIKVVQGDTISFEFHGFHTFTFPKGKPPFLFAASGTVADQKDATGNPFWFNGQARAIIDPTAAGPIGDGKISNKATDSSGLPGGDDNTPPPPYKASFAKPGTYKYQCLVHPAMKGQVTVLKKGKKAPSKKSDQARVAKQVASLLKTAKRLDAFKGPGGSNVRAGNDTKDVSFFKYFSNDITVKAGTTVRWQQTAGVNEIHTITFGPEDYLKPIGQTFIAPDSSAPQNGPPTLVINPLAAYPSDPPTAVPAYDGTNHGNGFLNSGIIDDDSKTPFPRTFAASFTKPGTYVYICLVHGPDMNGKVNVTP
jgi:plastocyanin